MKWKKKIKSKGFLRISFIFSIISLILSPTNSIALDSYHFSGSIADINNIEYFIEFSPTYGIYSTTNYSISLTHILDSFIHADIAFNDLQITYAQYDYSYNLNLSNDYWKIQDINPLVCNYINAEHSELLCNLSEPFKETQYFRIDELITFEPYLNKNSINLISRSTSKEFTFIEETIFNRNLKFDFNVYRFTSQFTFEGPPDSSCGWGYSKSWIFTLDYYFSKDLGLLIGEKLHLYRFDHPIGYDTPKKNAETLVIYKTLARINSDIILNYHKPLPPWIITLIVILPIVTVSVILILKRKIIFKLNLKKE